MTAHDVRLDEGTIRYYRAGDAGPVVVLLHGGVLDSSELAYGAVVPRLAGVARVVVLDWPEHGHSWPWAAPTDEATLGSVLARMVDHWAPERFTLVGLSQGGGMAIRYALDHPERLDGMVAIGPTGLEDRAWVLAAMSLPIRLAWLPRVATRLLARHRWLVTTVMWIARTRGKRTVGFRDAVDIGHDQARVAARHGETILDDYLTECYRWPGRRIDYRPAAARLSVPALIVHGEKDRSTSARALRRAVAAMPRARYAQVPGVGHLSPRDDPEAIARIITDALDLPEAAAG